MDNAILKESTVPVDLVVHLKLNVDPWRVQTSRHPVGGGPCGAGVG